MNFIQNHPPPPEKTPGTRLEGSKNPHSGPWDNHYVQPPSGQNGESKAPPLGHKVKKLHKYIFSYEL